MTKSEELNALYARRFSTFAGYRRELWKVLTESYFQALIPTSSRLLDLGCGYGQFVNAIRADAKYAMDLNPRSGELVDADVRFFLRDCSERWPFPDNSLDVVFTSNFLEHLPDKTMLRQAIGEAARCIAPGGQMICLGPNIRCINGAYWDFWDHHIPLSDRSISELLEISGFRIERRVPRFLPYTMAEGGRMPPLALVRAYLKMKFLWRIFGKQFLVVGRKQ